MGDCCSCFFKDYLDVEGEHASKFNQELHLIHKDSTRYNIDAFDSELSEGI